MKIQQRRTKRRVLIGAKRCDELPCFHGGNFNAVAAGQLLWFASRRWHGPEVATVDVLLVRCVEEILMIGGEADVFYLEVAGSQQERFAACSRHGAEMRPTVGLPGKGEAIVLRPAETRSVDAAEGAAPALLR